MISSAVVTIMTQGTNPADAFVLTSPCKTGVEALMAILDSGFCGVGWNHSIAGIVEQQSCE